MRGTPWLDLPVRQHEPRCRSFLVKAAERHSQIGPPNVSAQGDYPAKRLEEISLAAQRKPARPAPPRKISDGMNETVEPRLVLEHELEHSQLFARATFDERRRMRQRESNDPIALVEQHRITQREFACQQDFSAVVIPG